MSLSVYDEGGRGVSIGGWAGAGFMGSKMPRLVMPGHFGISLQLSTPVAGAPSDTDKVSVKPGSLSMKSRRRTVALARSGILVAQIPIRAGRRVRRAGELNSQS